MPVTDALMTVTSASKFIPDVWSAQVLEAIEFKTILAGLVWDVSSIAPEGKAYGDVVHIPRSSNLSTQTKAGGVNEMAPAWYRDGFDDDSFHKAIYLSQWREAA